MNTSLLNRLAIMEHSQLKLIVPLFINAKSEQM